MNFLQPSTWAEALAMKAAHPEALPIAGGTDVLVEINLDHNRPDTVMDLTRIADLAEWATEDGIVRGNLGTASPAGDAHPPLLASDALVELASASGTRRVPVRDFFTGPKRNAARSEEHTSELQSQSNLVCRL